MSLSFDAVSHRYAWTDQDGPRELISVTQVLRSVGLVDVTWFTPEAAERGTRVHLAIERYEREAVECDDAERGYLDAYWQWKADTQAVAVSVETRVADPVRGVAGTVDWLGLVSAVPSLIDIKTGAAAPWHAVQTAAYCRLNGPSKRACLYLSDDGTYRYQLHTERADFIRWDEALNLALWKRTHGYRD